MLPKIDEKKNYLELLLQIVNHPSVIEKGRSWMVFWKKAELPGGNNTVSNFGTPEGTLLKKIDI